MSHLLRSPQSNPCMYLSMPAPTCALCYVQDPHNLESYLANNIFLPDINNEKEDKHPQYADNLASLQRLVLYRFDDDTTGKQGRGFPQDWD